MTSDIIEVFSWSVPVVDNAGQYVEFVALVDDAVQTVPASWDEPAQFSAAVCEGKLRLADDDFPSSTAEFIALAEQVDVWTPAGY